MEAEYQRGLTGCFMILKTEEGHEQDSWQARILSVNQIEGLLPMTEEHIDNRQQFRYDITSLQPFDVFCSSRHVREEDLRKLFTGILGTLRTLEDYLLEGEHLLLDPQYLYVSWEDCRMCAPYHPYYRASVRESLRTLTEYILRKIGTEDQAAVILACRFLHALETEYLQIPDLMKVLQKEEVSVFGEYEEPEITERQKADSAPGFIEQEERRKEYRSDERKMRQNGGQRDFELSGMAGMDGVDEILRYGEAGKADRQRTGRIAPHLPERATLLTALILTPAAGVIYLLLHLQTIVVMNRTEAVLAAAALAGGVLLCTISSALYRKKKASGQEKSSIQTKGGNAKAKAGNTQTKKGRSRREEEGALFREAEKEYFGIGFPEEGMDSFYGDAADPDALLEEHTHTMLLNFENPFDHGKEKWTLQPVQADSSLLPIPLEGDSFLIGQKGGPADVGIADQTVSRIHARVFQRNGSWFLTDMSSRNGTSVNGKKAVGREEIPLSDGAVVSFARCEYKVCME